MFSLEPYEEILEGTACASLRGKDKNEPLRVVY